ncbi:MAG: GGDEF domain-containing protein [Terracidiphilus sp.]
MASIARNSIVLRPIDLALVGKALAGAMGLVFAAHLVLILVAGQSEIAASRYLTAALVALAAACALWRALLLPWRERSPWMLAALGAALWAVAHALEAFLAHSSAASVLTMDEADFIYIVSILLLLIALSTPREVQSVRALVVLNSAQIALALVLAWVLLYGTSLSPQRAVSTMGRIYGSACLLLAVMGLLRLFSWATQEEKQCFRTINFFLWTYLPVELGMDYLTQHRGLRAGTLLDLAWSIPFALAGWNALTRPLGKGDEPSPPQRSRASLLVDCLCPVLLTAAIFALAAAVVPRHMALGLASMFFLLAVQGIQAAVVQMNYLAGRNLLLDREHKLRTANAALEQLTLLDPLTGVANRRGFDSAFDAAWRRALRRHYPVTLLLIDVDSFKAVNDLHGHAYGDECLVAIARAMDLLARRPDDHVARLGGEEFALLLPETGADGAVLIARRLHESVRKLALANQGSPFDRLLTVSIGIAICMPASGTQPAAVFEAADQALYSAKDQGRNRTYSVLLRAEGSDAPKAAEPGPAPQQDGTE